MLKISKALFVSLAFLSVICLSVVPAFSQKRDNLTDEEDMQVRDAQQVDWRMSAFVKIVNRRLTAINGVTASDEKQVQKEIAEWGALRTGTRTELFWDIEKTINESISKIDDVAERNSKNPLFGKAVHILADGCKKWLPQFTAFQEKATEEKERASIVSSIDYCNQIIEASSKVSKDVPKDASKEKNKKN